MPRLSINFITSALAPTKMALDLPEVVIFGRSNVGKSSFINALANTKVARSSSTPGRTRLLNYFQVEDLFYFVDAPGYGYAKVSKSMQVDLSNMIYKYLLTSKKLKLVLLLIDSRLPLQPNDQQMIDFLNQHQIKFVVIATKSDKLDQRMRQLHKNQMQKQVFYQDNYYLVSALDPNSLTSITQFLLNQFQKV